MLKERIRRVLSLEPGRPPLGIGRVLRVLAICLACVTPILALSAQARPLLLHPADPLFGTWTNPVYDGSAIEVAARMVLSADGSQKDYRRAADSQPYMTGTFTLEAAWIDEEGNHWYKMLWVGDYSPTRVNRPGFKLCCLTKVNAAGTLLDTIPGRADVYPRNLEDSQIRFGAHKQYQKQ